MLFDAEEEVRGGFLNAKTQRRKDAEETKKFKRKDAKTQSQKDLLCVFASLRLIFLSFIWCVIRVSTENLFFRRLFVLWPRMRSKHVAPGASLGLDKFEILSRGCDGRSAAVFTALFSFLHYPRLAPGATCFGRIRGQKTKSCLKIMFSSASLRLCVFAFKKPLRTSLFKLLCFFLIFLSTSSLTAEEPWGKDVELVYWRPENCPQRPPRLNPLARVGELLVSFHQEMLSDSDGPRSHFEPTSSEYTRQAMVKYGFFKGVMYGCDRLMRENNDPWIYPKVIGRYDMYMKVDPVP